MIEKFKKTINEKIRKSEVVNLLKELSSKIPKEEFLEFVNYAIMNAYRSNRVKSVEYMLSAYDGKEPDLLFIIHVQRMLADEKKFEKSKKMLAILSKSFPIERYEQIVVTFLKNKHGDIKLLCQQREKEMYAIILDNKLDKENKVVVKRPKI